MRIHCLRVIRKIFPTKTLQEKREQGTRPELIILPNNQLLPSITNELINKKLKQIPLKNALANSHRKFFTFQAS